MIKIAIIALLLVLNSDVYADEYTCFHVASYSDDYSWQKQMKTNLTRLLQGTCKYVSYDLDSKAETDEAKIKAKAQKAYVKMQSLEPDVVILSDDNASRYFGVPYLKDKEKPVIFIGVNYEAKKYQYPWDNATGMVEVKGLSQVLSESEAVLGRVPNRIAFLANDTVTERLDANRYKSFFERKGLQYTFNLVNSMNEWRSVYKKLQQSSDLVILNNNAGLENWDKEQMVTFVQKNTSKLTASVYPWMVLYTIMSIQTQAKEFCEYVAKVVAELKNGDSIHDFPIIPNRNFRYVINKNLFEESPFKIPQSYKSRLKRSNFYMGN
jgi:ABC-type uncharacterized transport system substrate-binding protein